MSEPLVSDIKRAVAISFHADPAVFDEPDGIGARAREKVRPRQVAMAMALTMTHHGASGLRRYFGGRDHSTILHARKAASAFLRTDIEARACTRRALKLLRGAQ